MHERNMESSSSQSVLWNTGENRCKNKNLSPLSISANVIDSIGMFYAKFDLLMENP